MTLPPVRYCQIRGGTYHLNLPVPTQLRPAHGGIAALRRSLKTSDTKVAEREARAAKADLDRELAAALAAAAAEAQRDRLAAALPPEERKLLADLGGIRGVAEELRSLRATVAFLSAGAGGTATDEILDRAAQIEAQAETAEAQARLGVITAEARKVRGVADALQIEIPAPPKGAEESAAGMRALAAAFAKAKSYTVQNTDALGYTVRRWIEFHGDLALDKLTRLHLAEFDTAAADLPSTFPKAEKALPMREVIAAREARNGARISYKTRNRLVTHLKALSAFACTKGLIPADPWVGYRMDKPKVKASERKKAKVTGLPPKTVKTVLDHIAATADHQTADYWLPLLCAYTGARREEIGQLRVGDVFDAGSIPFIMITDAEDGQSVKNQNSLRGVPVPPAVQKVGFLDYVKARREAGAAMLFQEVKHRKLIDLAPDKRGHLTEDVGQRFTRTLERLGLKDGRGGLHRLRHSWTDAARRAGIDREIRRMIAGRTDAGDPVEAGYGGGDLLAEKLAALVQMEPFIID